MALHLTAEPASEPLTLAEAKHHLRIDTTDDDAFIASLITTSRLHVEAALGLAIITQGWRLELDRWPGKETPLPIRPLRSIDAVTIFDQSGNGTVVPATAYIEDAASTPPRLIAADTTLPAPGRTHRGITIDITAGFGDAPANVPQPIRHALLMLVAHWYEHREAVATGERGARMPLGVNDLLAPWRPARL